MTYPSSLFDRDPRFKGKYFLEQLHVCTYFCEFILHRSLTPCKYNSLFIGGFLIADDFQHRTEGMNK